MGGGAADVVWLFWFMFFGGIVCPYFISDGAR